MPPSRQGLSPTALYLIVGLGAVLLSLVLVFAIRSGINKDSADNQGDTVSGSAFGSDRARDAQRKADLRAVKNALETYYNDNNFYPGGGYSGLQTELLPDYLPSLPSDPGKNAYTYEPSPTDCVECDSYILRATLENPDDEDTIDNKGTYEVESIN